VQMQLDLVYPCTIMVEPLVLLYSNFKALLSNVPPHGYACIQHITKSSSFCKILFNAFLLGWWISDCASSADYFVYI